MSDRLGALQNGPDGPGLLPRDDLARLEGEIREIKRLAALSSEASTASRMRRSST